MCLFHTFIFYWVTIITFKLAYALYFLFRGWSHSRSFFTNLLSNVRYIQTVLISDLILWGRDIRIIACFFALQQLFSSLF